MTDRSESKLLQGWIPVLAAGFAIIAAVSSYFVEQGTRTAEVNEMQAKLDSQSRSLQKIEGAVQALQLFQAAQAKSDCQQFARIETQFGTVETVLNSHSVATVRALDSLKFKVFGEQEPSIYYPVSIPHEVGGC